MPRQQRFGQYTRSLDEGTRRAGSQSVRAPACHRPGHQISSQPLCQASDLDTRGWLNGVQTFNFHPHLPHYAVTTDDTSSIHVLARQPIDVRDRIRSRKPVTGSSTVPLDAADKYTRWRYPARRFDDLHHPIRRHGESRVLLAEHGEDAVEDLLVDPAVRARMDVARRDGCR